MSHDKWSEPGVYQVAPGVHRIPLQLRHDSLKAVNVYAIIDGDHLVLIDSGWATEGSIDEMRGAIRTLGFDLPDIHEFLITHVHRDHYTQAVAVRRLVGSRISLGRHERPNLDALLAARKLGRRGSSSSRRLGQAAAFGIRDELDASIRDRPVDPNFELPDTWLENGTRLPLENRSLSVISTPGHTNGHVVFADDDHHLLFAGDHVLPHITPSIGFEPVQDSSPLAEYLGSLATIRARPDAVLLPAHGAAGGSVHARVDELLDHHEQRLTATVEAVAKGAATGYDVASALPWTRHGRRLSEMDLQNRALAVTETMAHLDVLVARGELLVAARADGALTYTLAIRAGEANRNSQQRTRRPTDMTHSG